VPLWFDLNMRRRLWSEAEAKPVLEWFCARADTVLAADDEAAIVGGAGEPLAQAQRLRDLGARQVVLKAASIGALCHDAMESVSVPRLANVTVRDPIGAGDAFAAGFLSARLDGLSAAAALQRGHVCAAAVCRTLGDWEGFPLRRDLARQAGGASR
jgi:2-dehydro-3-deoxygluconokinase